MNPSKDKDKGKGKLPPAMKRKREKKKSNSSEEKEERGEDSASTPSSSMQSETANIEAITSKDSVAATPNDAPTSSATAARRAAAQKHVRKKPKLGEIAANISKEEIAAAAAAAVTSIAAAAGPSAPPTEGDKDKDDEKDDGKNIKKKNRCGECRKKLGLTGFECRCGGLYCAIHRYSDKHNCTFNYREHGAQEIRRNNPVVVGEKIQKI